MKTDAKPAGAPDGELPTAQEALGLLEQLVGGGTFADMTGLSPQTLEVIYAAAHAIYMQGKYEQALRLFRFLVMQDHLDRRFHKAVAACLQHQALHADAVKHYGIASLLDPTDPEPVLHMVQCFLVLSRREEAEQALSFAEGQIEGEARYAALGERVRVMRELMDRRAGQGASP